MVSFRFSGRYKNLGPPFIGFPKYGAKVASKLLLSDVDIWLLYKRAVDLVEQDATQIAQLAETLCRVVADAKRQSQCCQWRWLMLAIVIKIL